MFPLETTNFTNKQINIKEIGYDHSDTVCNGHIFAGDALVVATVSSMTVQIQQFFSLNDPSNVV